MSPDFWNNLHATYATSDLLIFGLVLGARFLVPLLIPRYPLPGIIAALLLDAADQTIFQRLTSLPLDGYQGYDKALDIYYLTIAYISTLRNWTNEFAFKLSRFLFYYRLVGVALFEFTGLRVVLLLFPNTFEYFFIFYEAVRLRWDPRKISSIAWLGAATAIWVFIKVPQEYWIHIAQLDTTDLIVELFTTAVPGTWQGFVVNNWPRLIATALGLAIVVFYYMLRRLPAADYSFQIVPTHAEQPYSAVQMRQAKALWSSKIFDRDMLEKAVLVMLVSFIFAHILPNFNVSYATFALALFLFVILNTLVSHVLARRNWGWSSTLLEFAGLLGINSLIAYLIFNFMQRSSTILPLYNILFFALLLTIIISLFDRYEQLHIARFPRAWEHQSAD